MTETHKHDELVNCKRCRKFYNLRESDNCPDCKSKDTVKVSDKTKGEKE